MPTGVYERTDAHRAAIGIGLCGNRNRFGKTKSRDAPITFTPGPDGRQHVAFPFLFGRCRAPQRARVVWMLSRHQSLPVCLWVHHANDIKSDDRPENLAAMWPREHRRWHNWERS